ncbi:MFS transporter [Pontibacillus litoralis]|uniref:Permease n=1 Tax=Pontibacillus litoralis JSM 072002 TaxID=1385512 RepID=A0A0A5FV78_9BACI|nr:MFS transporter [Pontibacillus litoralis]KGX84691.1 permease [Pontibacillus litoralis JSM 072002]
MDVKKWKNPLLLLLTGIGISNLGAWIYFIALNLIVLDMTKSPFAVSILYILVPAATFFSNFWSGSVIDRTNKRKLMIALDISRSVLIFALPFLDSIFLIYVVVFLINIGSTAFESTSLVYMTKLVSEGNRQRFNSFKNLIQSCGFILGPSIAGMLFIVGTPTLAIQFNSLSLIISACIIFFLPNLEAKIDEEGIEKYTLQLIYKDWTETLRFTKQNKYVTLVYSLFCVMTIFMSGLDSLEASFATQVLNFSESTYGFLVTTAGIGIITGSIINAIFTKYLKLYFLISFGAIATPVGYLIFAYSQDFTLAAIGFFLLTFSLSFANTGFLSFYQNNVPTYLMGRFSGVIGVVESVIIIVLTFGIGLLAEYFGIRPTYIVASLTFLIIGIFINMIVLNKSKANYFLTAITEERPKGA